MFTRIWINFLPKLCQKYFCSLQIELSLEVFSRIPKFLSYQHVLSYGDRNRKQFSFLVVEVICEQGKFTTTIYHKPNFSDMYSNSESFLPSVYKFGIVHTLVYACFQICSDWTKFPTELTFWKGYFIKMVTLTTLLTSVLKSF